jgi:hypothetical protein
LSCRRPVDREPDAATAGVRPGVLVMTTEVRVGTLATPPSVMVPPPTTRVLPMSYVEKLP